MSTRIKAFWWNEHFSFVLSNVRSKLLQKSQIKHHTSLQSSLRALFMGLPRSSASQLIYPTSVNGYFYRVQIFGWNGGKGINEDVQIFFSNVLGKIRPGMKGDVMATLYKTSGQLLVKGFEVAISRWNTPSAQKGNVYDDKFIMAWSASSALFPLFLQPICRPYTWRYPVI